VVPRPILTSPDNLSPDSTFLFSIPSLAVALSSSVFLDIGFFGRCFPARRDRVRVVADVFEDRRDMDRSRMNLWWLIRDMANLDWQLVTKRPENIARLLPVEWRTNLPPHVRIEVTA